MNRTIKAIFAIFFIGVITFSAISICQNLDARLSWKADLTQQKIYSLSDGTKSILAKLNQPITIKLYYSKTASMKATDDIQQYNEYYFFVRALLEEYAAQSNGMVKLEVIDPRPYSEDEQEALRYGLRRFQITEDESYFFGLVAKTEFGATKSIEFFSQDRQNFVEYDISYLIDTLLTREKRRIGVLSSLPVMGDDVTGYMAQMKRMQGQELELPWELVTALKKKYDVIRLEPDLDSIEDIDILLLIHPKDLPQKTLFAIDQFVLRGGRTIVSVDPHCFLDLPDPQAMRQGIPPESGSSNLSKLMNTWGVNMKPDIFAGDLNLAMKMMRRNGAPETIIGILELKKPDCFNTKNTITTDLNQVQVWFAGALEQLTTDSEDTEEKDKDTNQPSCNFVPLLTTTPQGNTWKVSNPYELQMMNSESLMANFTPGTKPVVLGGLITGRFKSAFPDGIEVEVESEADPESDEDGTKPEKEMKKITGLIEAAEDTDCAVVIFTDVDFLANHVAFSSHPLFGMFPRGDNLALVLNTLESISGSGDLIAIRSRGNFQRPFTLIDEIEKETQKETAEEEEKITAEIEKYQEELRNIVNEARNKGETVIDAAELAGPTAEINNKIRIAEGELRKVQDKRRQKIEALQNRLKMFNILLAPAIIMVIVIVLSLRRSLLRRRYISHASDA